VFGVFAQLDRAMVVKRLRDGRMVKAATGRKAVGAYAYGYRRHGKGRERDAAPEPTEQQAVRRIMELRSENKSYREIVRTLEAEGHRPRRADQWSPMSVRNIVCREVEPSAA
jgi:DNA invertase Pin-like site-specific DNA recombinase